MQGLLPTGRFDCSPCPFRSTRLQEAFFNSSTADSIRSSKPTLPLRLPHVLPPIRTLSQGSFYCRAFPPAGQLSRFTQPLPDPPVRTRQWPAPDRSFQGTLQGPKTLSQKQPCPLTVWSTVLPGADSIYTPYSDPPPPEQPVKRQVAMQGRGLISASIRDSSVHPCPPS